MLINNSIDNCAFGKTTHLSFIMHATLPLRRYNSPHGSIPLELSVPIELHHHRALYHCADFRPPHSSLPPQTCLSSQSSITQTPLSLQSYLSPLSCPIQLYTITSPTTAVTVELNITVHLCRRQAFCRHRTRAIDHHMTLSPCNYIPTEQSITI